jgi:hypothetical protein
MRGRGLNRGWSYQGSSYRRQHEGRKNYERVMSIINWITRRQSKSRLEETGESWFVAYALTIL